MDRRAVVRWRWAGRLPQILAGGSRLRKIPRHLGNAARSRQEAQGQGPSGGPDGGAHLWRRAGVLVPLPMVVGRQGGRGGREDGRAEQQGNYRVGQVRSAVLEGGVRRR